MKFKDYKLKIHNVEKHVRLNPVMKTKKDYDEEILRLNEYYEKIRTYEKEVEEDKDLTDSEREQLVMYLGAVKDKIVDQFNKVTALGDKIIRYPIVIVGK